MRSDRPRDHQLTHVTDHRPWPLPSSPWILAQSWHNLLFAHWPLPADALRALVPPQLELDTWEGQAWVSVVPFEMQHVHPRGTITVPWLSHFPELNVRTYVKRRDGSRPGVWFFSLDAANPVAVWLARRFFRLPYLRARMAVLEQGETIHYQSWRTHAKAAPAKFVAQYRPCGPAYAASPGSLDHWLAERYCLYAVDRAGVAYSADIHHRPWPLQPAAAVFAVNEMTTANGFRLPACEPLLHFVRHLDVVTWRLRRIE